MKNPLRLSATRREFIAGAGGVATLAGVTSATQAGEQLAAAASASVVLHDPGLAMPADVAARLVANGARIIALNQDPVRLWREDLGKVLRDPGTRIFGLTLWADYLIVRGLAAETRKHPRFEQLHPETGQFTWLIA